MGAPRTSPDLIDAIRCAGHSETDGEVAERLRISIPTVRRYRKAVRLERHEAAREIIAEHVEAELPDALTDLGELRRKAKAVYLNSADHRDGGLWLNAIKATLEHVTPDDAELDRMLDAEVLRLSGRDQAPPD